MLSSFSNSVVTRFHSSAKVGRQQPSGPVRTHPPPAPSQHPGRRRCPSAAAAAAASGGGGSGGGDGGGGGSGAAGGRYVPGPDDMAPSIAAAGAGAGAAAGAAGAGGGVRARAAAVDLGLDPLAVSAPVYTPAERLTLDESPAEVFFGRPRLGAAARHTDPQWAQRLTDLYRRVLLDLVGPSGGGGRTSAPPVVVVDLCSAALSHLPPELLELKEAGRLQLVGHGVNEEELAANPAFAGSSSSSGGSSSGSSSSGSSSSWTFTADLNASPRLPLLASGSAAAVLCANGIQYLTRPEWVLAEVARVLAPGGVVVVAFSDACWRERAAAGWLGRSGPQRLQLMEELFMAAGISPREVVAVTDPPPSDTTTPAAAPPAPVAPPPRPDAFYALVGHKPLAPTADGVAAADSAATAAAAAGATPQQQQQQQQQAAGSGPGVLAADADPAAVAARYPGPALREMDLLPALNGTPNGVSAPHPAAAGTAGAAAAAGGVSAEVLERWAEAYGQLVEDAAELGVPRSAIPQLPPGPVSAQQLRAARDHLQDMIASFLSAGL